MKDADRELLEMAAKATGLDVERRNNPEEAGCECMAIVWNGVFQSWWNPLEDDGDAFRLAFGLGIQVHMNDVGSIEAVRRDIVRAAAEIVKQMK